MYWKRFFVRIVFVFIYFLFYMEKVVHADSVF